MVQWCGDKAEDNLLELELPDSARAKPSGLILQAGSCNEALATQKCLLSSIHSVSISENKFSQRLCSIERVEEKLVDQSQIPLSFSRLKFNR